MADDIRLVVSFKGHRKRKRLRRALGDRSDSYLIDLWLTIRMDAPKGVLVGWDKMDIADAACYSGDEEEFVSALVDCGWLDVGEDGVYSMHDWDKHQAWACGAGDRSAAASAAAKARWDKKLKLPATDSNAEPMRSACTPHSGVDAKCNAPSPSPSPSPSPNPSQGIGEAEEVDNEKCLLPKRPTPKKKKYGEMENVSLSEDEFIKLQDKFQDHEEKINNLSLYISSKGDKYKSHYATILSWDRKDKKENNAIMQPRNKKEVHDETRERFARELLEAGDTGYKPDYRRNEELDHKI